MSLQQIRDALDAALTALDIRPVQEIDRAPNVTGTACAAIVEWAGANYLVAFNDQTNDATFRIVVLTGRASERTSRQKLDLLVDPSPRSTTALRNTLTGDLGDQVGFCQVASATEYRNYPVGEADYLGCEFTVVIGT
jgi:hypothetical protein